METCIAMVISNERLGKVATPLGHASINATAGVMSAAVTTCITWQLKWLCDDQNVECRPRLSLSGSASWFGTVGARTCAMKPIKPWNYEGRWLDLERYNRSALKTVVGRLRRKWTHIIVCKARSDPRSTLDGGRSGEAAASSSGATRPEGTIAKESSFYSYVAHLARIAASVLVWNNTLVAANSMSTAT